MSFGYSRNSGISWMRDYGDAFHKYQSTTDIRGRVAEPKRPLGHRKSVDSYSIRLKGDGSMGVECVLWRTPVVTYYPTGLVEVTTGGWSSVSTTCFINELTPYRARIFNGSLCITVGGVEVRMDESKPLQIMDGKILNPTKDKTHSLIRGGTNNVRKQYAEFVKFACALVRLKADGFMGEEYKNTFTEATAGSPRNFKDMPECLDRPHYTYFPDSVRELFALVKSEGEDKHLAHYKATLALAHAFGSNTWNGTDRSGICVTEKELKRGFDSLILGYHRDELFIEKEREIGEVKKDPYKKYFESGWDRLHLTKLCDTIAKAKNLT
jgi:hypothetical protein